MAEEEKKIVLERSYNVPLRKEFMKAPRYKRAKKAVKALKEFIARHMKAEDSSKVLVSVSVNNQLWSRGIKNPMHHILVKAVKYDDGIVEVLLPGSAAESKTSKKRSSTKEKEKDMKDKEEENKEHKNKENKDNKESEAKGQAKGLEKQKAEPEAEEKQVTEKKEEPEAEQAGEEDTKEKKGLAEDSNNKEA